MRWVGRRERGRKCQGGRGWVDRIIARGPDPDLTRPWPDPSPTRRGGRLLCGGTVAWRVVRSGAAVRVGLRPGGAGRTTRTRLDNRPGAGPSGRIRRQSVLRVGAAPSREPPPPPLHIPLRPGPPSTLARPRPALSRACARPALPRARPEHPHLARVARGLLMLMMRKPSSRPGPVPSRGPAEMSARVLQLRRDGQGGKGGREGRGAGRGA
jgi:hypothetical protein